MDPEESGIKIIPILKFIVLGRWLIICALVILEFLLKSLHKNIVGFPLPILISIGAFVILYNSFYTYYLYLRKDWSLRTLNVIKYMQVFLDEAMFTLIIYFSGGIQSPDYYYYSIPILIASILLSPIEIFLAIIAAMVMYFGMVGAEINGFIPHFARYSSDINIKVFTLYQDDVMFRLSELFPALIAILFLAPFASSIAWHLREKEKELTLERNSLSFLINKLDFGLLVFNQNREITLTNETAREQFNLSSVLKHKIDDMLKKDGKIDLVSENIIDKIIDKTFKLNFSYLSLKDGTSYAIIIEDVTKDIEISEMKSQFISIAAHQLRTPLSAIKWIVSFFLQGDVGSISTEQKDLLEKAYISNERMIRLVDDLLNVSRIEENRIAYNFEKEKLETVIDSVVDFYKIRAKDKNITFNYIRNLTNSFYVWVDLDKIKMVFDNILDNAFKYTPSGGKINIELHYNKNNAQVIILDDGIGIPKNEMDKLYTKFFRAQNVIRFETEGTGLGLFIVKSIVESHGGKILCDSNVGKGTKFTIEFNKNFIPEKKIFKI